MPLKSHQSFKPGVAIAGVLWAPLSVVTVT